ncbi:hypothetical protein J2S74_003030 [Evansella vedderi]|uniref:Uncharacterized protein n=1 Tax=Evansella vedderi TaxID=38282 RepID=A0ABT9ZWN9_9BACI|nr:hypothetical protein [Evansella vedderi]MDQ0255648.1 hypothetical protein [Evansella vedderi]
MDYFFSLSIKVIMRFTSEMINIDVAITSAASLISLHPLLYGGLDCHPDESYM